MPINSHLLYAVRVPLSKTLTPSLLSYCRSDSIYWIAILKTSYTQPSVLCSSSQLSEAICFQFCNELFTRRSAVRYRVICWHWPRPDLGTLFYYGILSSFGLREEALNECFRSAASALVPPNNNSPAYQWIIENNGFLLMGSQWVLFSLEDKYVSGH